MALTALILACLLSYTTSRYFPARGIAWVRDYKATMLGLAGVLLLLSLWLFTFDYDGATAFIIWLIAWMTVLCTLMLTVKFSLKWLYVWSVIGVFSFIIDIL
ncbi:MAG: hypothetical protein ACFB0B_06005 [Thermonemataceae bacterium]|mgnify:CR=1 FL=1